MAANAQEAAARARTAASADVVCSIYDSQGSVLSYSLIGGFESGAMLEVGFTKNGAILKPAGAIQSLWTSERDNGRVVLRSTRDTGWLRIRAWDFSCFPALPSELSQRSPGLRKQVFGLQSPTARNAKG